MAYTVGLNKPFSVNKSKPTAVVDNWPRMVKYSRAMVPVVPFLENTKSLPLVPSLQSLLDCIVPKRLVLARFNRSFLKKAKKEIERCIRF